MPPQSTLAQQPIKGNSARFKFFQIIHVIGKIVFYYTPRLYRAFIKLNFVLFSLTL